jgi:hypothetical protein
LVMRKVASMVALTAQMMDLSTVETKVAKRVDLKAA